MNHNETAPPEPQRSTFRAFLYDSWHYLLALYVVLLALGTLMDFRQLEAPNAPVMLFWSTVVVGALLAILLLPFIISRLPRKLRRAVYTMTALFIFLVITNMVLVGQAWRRTPEGAAEATASEQAEQVEAAAAAQQANEEAQLQQEQQTQQQAADRQQKLEHCFSYFGHRLPKLESEVKSGLGNPDAFKQVETKAIPTDADGYNVIMTFMAQNRMGALWKFDLRATVDPDTCDVTKVEPEPSES